MSKITDLPYYFSVQNSSTSEDLKNNFFGLLDIKQNRFYILHRNHSLLKFLQIMLIKNFYTFSIISFAHFNFTAHRDIDNHDCSDWGSTPNTVETLELEVDTLQDGVKLIKEDAASLTPADVRLQKNMLLVMYILTNLDNLFKKIRDYETERKKSACDGHSELKRYFRIICPNDKNIDNFIEAESKQTHAKLNELDKYWDKLLLFFYNADLRGDLTTSLLQGLKEHIQMPQFQLEHFRRLYQHPYNAIEELYQILDITDVS
jgi:hypothetical protein